MALPSVVLRVERTHENCQGDRATPLSKCCAGKIESALRQVNGVDSVVQGAPQTTVNSSSSSFVITVKGASPVTLRELKDAVTCLGNYRVETSGIQEQVFQIRGLQPDAAKKITGSLLGVKGVLHAGVNTERKIAVVWTEEGVQGPPASALKEAIESSCKSPVDMMLSSLGGAVDAISSITVGVRRTPSQSSSIEQLQELQAEPQGGPDEQQLLLRIGNVAVPGSARLLKELESVQGVVAVELVESPPGAPSAAAQAEEVRVFFRSNRPVSVEALQVAAVKGGAGWSEVVNVRHALDGVRLSEIAEQIHSDVTQIVLDVQGMSSKRCVAVVKQSLESVAGVTGVTVLGPEPDGTCPSEAKAAASASSSSSCCASPAVAPPGAQKKVLVSLEKGSAITPDMLFDAVERWAPPCCGRVKPVVPGASQVLVALTGVDTKERAQVLSAALAEVPGVVFQSVSIADQEALIIGQPSVDLLLKAVGAIGCRAEVSQVVSNPLASPAVNAPRSRTLASPSKAIFKVGGMTCSACSGAVETALLSLGGVQAAQVNLLTEKAIVEFDMYEISAEGIADEIEDIGYEAELLEELTEGAAVTMTTARLTIGDMSCSSCANSVEEVLRSQHGVESATVNFAISKATVQFDSSKTGLRSLVEAVEEAGFSASPEAWDPNFKKSRKAGSSEAGKWALLFWWGLCCALPIATITMGLHHLRIQAVDAFLNKEVGRGLTVENLICLVLSTLSQFGPPGFKFYRDSWHGLMRCAPNMALLVSLGTSVSYVYGLYGLVSGVLSGKPSPWADDYFEVAADLIAFITLGKWLEARAKGATSMVLHKLLDLKPQTAVLLTVNSTGQVVAEREIPAEQLQVGDVLKVIRGASVPADGVVVVGTAEVDESMLTGESMPVTKSIGDTMLGATVVREGTVFLQVTSTGADSVLSQIVRMIEDAQASKPPIQALADAISRVFVPTIVAISLAVFSGWFVAVNLGVVPSEWMGGRTPLAFALNLGIATMVVACPCAMGLAVPTAVMVGTGVAAKHGVLIKEGEAIEHARKVTAIIFDKTGTLTEGKPKVTDMIPLGSQVPVPEIVRLTGAAETSSEHPLGRALVSYAQETLNPDSPGMFLGEPKEFSAESGKGLQCKVDGRLVIIGTKSWMQEMKVTGMTAEALEAARRLEIQAKTAVLVAVDLQVAAVFGIADAPRPESVAVLKKLNSMGIATWMVTGDNRATANSIAEKLQLSEEFVMAEVLPGNKARQVKSLQEQGHIVAMVGDGINDAPALAQAHLGLAIGNGTDIAIEAAGMVLIGGQLSGVVVAIDVSRSIHNRIWTNFGWAFVYNLVLIPAAAGAAFPFIGATLPAWAAGAAMAMSSVSVVFSSLLLNLYRAPQLPQPRKSSSTTTAPASLSQVVVVANGSSNAAGAQASGHDDDDDAQDLTRPLLSQQESSIANGGSE